MSTNTVPHTPRGPGTRNKSLTIILSVLGGLVLLGLVLGTSWSSITSLNRTDSVQTADATGIDTLEVEANAGEFTLQFADITEARLEVRSSRGAWDLERQGNTLVVDSPGGWGNWCFFGCDSRPSVVVLSLPEFLNDGQLDVQLSLAAGEFITEGDFKTLDMDMSAGRLVALGAADSVDLRLGAGQATVELADVHTARFDISAGRLDGVFSGSAPASVQGEVSAGMLDLTLPEAGYDVRSTVSAGNLDNRLATASDSAHQVTMDVSAGNVVLRPAS